MQNKYYGNTLKFEKRKVRLSFVDNICGWFSLYEIIKQN